MNEPGEKASRRWSLRARGGAALVSTAVALAAAGVGWRFVQAQAPTRPTGDYALCLVDGAGRPLTELQGTLRLTLDPFTVYRNAPNQRTESYWIDAHGFRGGLGDGTRPRVFLLGGSAAFGQDLPSDEDALPAKLSKEAADVEIVNAAVVGFLAGQELALMVHHLDRFGAAGYVALDGWNEIFDQYHFGGRPDPRLGFNNAFFDVEQRLHERCAALAGRPPQPRPPAAHDPERTFDALLSDYLDNLERMHAFARARGARFLAAIQPEMGQKRLLTAEERRALDAWNHAYGYVDRDFSGVFARFAERTAQYCASRDIPCVVVGRSPELADSTERLFLDPVHLSPAGSRVVARILAREMEQWRPLAPSAGTERAAAPPADDGSAGRAMNVR